jgi:hypothetical protein
LSAIVRSKVVRDQKRHLPARSRKNSLMSLMRMLLPRDCNLNLVLMRRVRSLPIDGGSYLS